MTAIPPRRCCRSAVLSALAPGVAISRPRSMEERVAANVAEPRFRALLLSLFAIVSLALAAVGLYGVVAFSVSQRRAELGLRLALGADPRSVLGLVIREGMTPVVFGIAAAMAGAAMLASVMRTLLFNVRRSIGHVRSSFDLLAIVGLWRAISRRVARPDWIRRRHCAKFVLPP
jgi:hypothetical protein